MVKSIFVASLRKQSLWEKIASQQFPKKLQRFPCVRRKTYNCSLAANGQFKFRGFSNLRLTIVKMEKLCISFCKYFILKTLFPLMTEFWGYFVFASFNASTFHPAYSAGVQIHNLLGASHPQS